MTNPVTMEPLTLRLLGDMAVETSSGEAGPTLPRKGWAVLAYLSAASGMAQPRDRLAEIFWPDLSPKAARSNLRQILLGLQRTLNGGNSVPPCIIADRQSIRLASDCHHRIDLVEFTTTAIECSVNDDPSRCTTCIQGIEAVTGLYRGEFMAGFNIDDCPEFEEWLQIHREALHRRALIFLERLSQCHEKLGNLDRALTFAQRVVELEPWNEEGQRHLIRLLALNGQRGAALSQYDSCRRKLREELGVLPEEATRTLAVRIQKSNFQSPPASAREFVVASPLPSTAWERRQVTVLYCQLSAPRADDPDDILELLREPQAASIRIVQRFSGHVVRTNDGGFLAYFGFPTALEHAAHLAVRAGLAFAGQEFSDLDLRIGIHTGLIITGGDPNLPDTIGRTSGLAVQLRGRACPGEVIVSEATKRIVSGYFEWNALPEKDGESSRAFVAMRESGATNRLGAAAVLTPLIGRDSEVATLLNHWRDVRGGLFRTLLLSGDPGIGKSRLVHFVKQEVVESGGIIRELHCFPEFSQSPFRPLIGLLEDLYGFTPKDDPEIRFAKMVEYQTAHHTGTDLKETAPLFAALLSLPVAPPYRPSDKSLRTQRERIMNLVVDQLRALAKSEPVLVVMEDLHWCDPTTLELLSRVVTAPDAARTFVLCTARPEFQSPWRETVMPLRRLAPLSDAAIRALIEALGLGIPVPAVRRIIAHADGVPLFAEELARAFPSTGYGADVGVPSTLQDLIATRLDAAAEDRSTAQLAAAVGREFSLSLLRELSPLDKADLIDSVTNLRDAGLVSRTGDDTFAFKHALFQDAAYRSQTKDDRMAAHRRIAKALQAHFPETVENRPEIPAQHWTKAGEAEIAIDLWIKAGRLANLHCANKEAISRFSSGMALLARMPEGQRKIHLEFDLQVGLGAAHFALEGYGSPNGAAAYARAVALGERHAGNPDLFNALWGLWACTSSRSNYDESLVLTLRLLRIGLRGTDPVKQQQGHFAVGNIRFWRGEFVEARGHLERAMALYQPEHHARLIGDFGENAYVTSGAYLSWTLCFLGFPDQAEETARQALEEAYRIDHPFSLGYTLTFVTVLQRMLGRPKEARAYAEETIALAEEHGYPLWKAGAKLIRGWALVRQGHREGIEHVRTSVDAVRSLMSGITLICLETLAGALRDLGENEAALVAIAEGWECVTRLHDRHVETELHRLKGECLLALPDRDDAETEAEACFRQAVSVARRQQAKLLELRAAMGLAGMWHRQGRSEEARELLSGVYATFTEGFDTHDLRDARRRLEMISGQ